VVTGERGAYRILERPALYRLVQALTAPGAERIITARLKTWLAGLPPAELLLDVACGPDSWLQRVGQYPVGLDLSPSYASEYLSRGGRAAVGSAGALPFAEGSFGGVWSFGLLHHLADPLARRAIQEMVRVCRSGGYVAVFDGILPRQGWQRPLAWGLRRLDRGRRMRNQAELRLLFPEPGQWRFERLTYSYTGLEGVLGTFLKP
jgi:SAM-dependent methyltransferase